RTIPVEIIEKTSCCGRCQFAANRAKYGGFFCPLTQLLVVIIREFGNIVNIWKRKTLRQNPTKYVPSTKIEKLAPA
ncbi:MAG TPA: hypothetical protein K8V20_10575, partial [Subdoligranulum variabile]|nr:hypothetical protein [Subdoligranulum variabile]